MNSTRVHYITIMLMLCRFCFFEFDQQCTASWQKFHSLVMDKPTSETELGMNIEPHSTKFLINERFLIPLGKLHSKMVVDFSSICSGLIMLTTTKSTPKVYREKKRKREASMLAMLHLNTSFKRQESQHFSIVPTFVGHIKVKHVIHMYGER